MMFRNIGDALDEATAFASGTFNVTYVPFKDATQTLSAANYLCRTEAEFLNYIHTFFYPRAPKDALLPLLDLYPNDPAQGSPFGTGDANQLAPMYKRMASFQGDFTFQAPRRFFLKHQSSKQPAWAYSKLCVVCHLAISLTKLGLIVSHRSSMQGLGFVSNSV